MTSHMTTEQHDMNKPAKPPTLPANPDGAVQQLCRLSQSLLDLAERESQALIQRDMLAFAILQDEKESLSVNYLEASQEFRARLNEFRRVPQGGLARLEKLQEELGHRTHDNNVLIEQIKVKAEEQTQRSLLAAQDYAQNGQGDQQSGEAA